MLAGDKTRFQVWGENLPISRRPLSTPRRVTAPGAASIVRARWDDSLAAPTRITNAFPHANVTRIGSHPLAGSVDTTADEFGARTPAAGLPDHTRSRYQNSRGQKAAYYDAGDHEPVGVLIPQQKAGSDR